MRISLIAAVAENGVIGREGGLPWRIPEDLKFFKVTTLGKPIIMGRKTYQSIGKPLPGRVNIVMTRDRVWHAAGVSVVHDLEAALRMAQETGADEAMIIGGADIYEMALPRADRIYLTRIEREFDGDAMFPMLDPIEWTETARTGKTAQDVPFDYSFVILERQG
ncbi:MAG: dihydrofolate reductase [Alphaproteobacteria bacterium]|nr:dihydrofolate reductase [Alphaproteobacteria bacterium]